MVLWHLEMVFGCLNGYICHFRGTAIICETTLHIQKLFHLKYSQGFCGATVLAEPWLGSMQQGDWP